MTAKTLAVTSDHTDSSSHPSYISTFWQKYFFSAEICLSSTRCHAGPCLVLLHLLSFFSSIFIFSAQTVLVFRVLPTCDLKSGRTSALCKCLMSTISLLSAIAHCPLLHHVVALSYIRCCFAGPSPPPCRVCCICLPLSVVCPILLFASSMSKGPTSDILLRENVRGGFG